jgi:hypothetical protein
MLPFFHPLCVYLMKDDVDKEVDILTEELENLQIEFEQRTNQLNFRINDLRSSKKGSQLKTFKVGDKVVITNNYNCCKGVQGEVLKITKSFVYLIGTFEDGTELQHKQAPKNLALV